MSEHKLLYQRMALEFDEDQLTEIIKDHQAKRDNPNEIVENAQVARRILIQLREEKK